MAENGQMTVIDELADAVRQRNETLGMALKDSSSLVAGEYEIKLDIFHETYEPAVRSTGWHTHERWYEFSLMRQGSMEYRTKDISIKITASDGDWILIPAGLKHCRTCTEPGSIVTGFQFTLGRSGLGEIKSGRFEKAIEDIGFHSESTEEIKHIFEELKTEIDNEGPLKTLRLNLLIKELLTLALRKAIPSAFRIENKRSFGDENSQHLARRISSYIEENLSKEIPLDELGRLCGISARHANRIFTKSFGMPLGRHMTLVRMKAARNELESGERQVKEIAGSLGYRDVSHFIRIFKRAYGLTPLEYRDSKH